MRSSRRSKWILLPLGLSVTALTAFSQGNLENRQERTIGPGRTDSFTLDLKKDQFLSLVVVQQGIDVGIAVVDPEGVQIRFVDAADGPTGTESVKVVAESTGPYQVEVLPLDQFRNPMPGRYEIGITDIRDATEQEQREGKIRALAKAHGLALLSDIDQLLQEVRDPDTRARFQLRAANLLWGNDDAHAVKLMTGAMDSLNEILAASGNTTTADTADVRSARQLRRQVIEGLVARDPERAVTYLRGTRAATDPDDASDKQIDRNFELTAATQIASTNPQRGFQIAEEVLKEGPGQGLIDIVRVLQEKSPELAATLVRDIMSTLANQRLVADAGAANLAASIIQFARTSGKASVGQLGPLVSSAEFTSFYQKAVSEVLAYSPPETYTAERNAALGLAQALTDRTDEVQNLQRDRASALSRKVTQLGAAASGRSTLPDVSAVPVDRGLAIAQTSSPDVRESMYEQLATKAAAEGDFDRARQIVNDYLPASSRQRVLTTARRQTVHTAASKGRLDEALRLVQTEPSPEARVAMLGQIVEKIGRGLKNSTAASLLEQARSMLDPSPRATGEEEMKVLIAIGASLARFDSGRASNILDPLVDQFNDLSLSAMVMNGFPEKYYRNGDLRMNGNNLAELATALADALAKLALTDAEHAKSTADRIRPTSARTEVYLQMAGKTIRASSWSD